MKRSLSNNQKSNNNKIKPTVDKNINYIEIAIGSKNQRNLNSLKSNKNTNINKNVINNFKVSNTSNKNQNQNAIKGFGVINKNINNPKKTEYDKPSLKYSHIKSSDPFAVGKKHKTNFGYVYSAGGIPCRIEHGSVRLKLKWDIEPDSKYILLILELDYDPILLVCFEGLLETDHPYNFASRQCIKEMLKAPGAYDKVVPIISKIINPLRMALSTNNETYSDTLEITQMVKINLIN
jgi:hypothetical protein